MVSDVDVGVIVVVIVIVIVIVSAGVNTVIIAVGAIMHMVHVLPAIKNL